MVLKVARRDRVSGRRQQTSLLGRMAGSTPGYVETTGSPARSSLSRKAANSAGPSTGWPDPDRARCDRLLSPPRTGAMPANGKSPVRPSLLLGGRNSASAGSSGPQTGLPYEDTLLRGDVTSTPAPEVRYPNCQIAPRRTRAPRSSILTRPRRRHLLLGPRHAFIGDWAGSRSGWAIRCRKPAFCRFKWSCWPLAPQVLPLVH